MTLPANLPFGLSIVLAVAASIATAAFAVSMAERLAPWFAKKNAQTTRNRRKRTPPPSGWAPLLSAQVAIAVGIVLTIALAFMLVVRVTGFAPA